MAVLTISREFGAGGRTLGERLANRLNYRYVNEEMIKEVARKANVSPEGVYAFEKSGGSKLMKFLDKLVRMDYLDRILQTDTGYLDAKRYVQLVSEIINEIYEAGNAVIIGRGGQYILQNKNQAYHVGLVAEYQFRCEFVMEKHGCSHEVAERAIQRADQERRSFLGCFMETGALHRDDPHLYHVLINTSKTGMQVAEDLVVSMVESGEAQGG